MSACECCGEAVTNEDIEATGRPIHNDVDVCLANLRDRIHELEDKLHQAQSTVQVRRLNQLEQGLYFAEQEMLSLRQELQELCQKAEVKESLSENQGGSMFRSMF